MGAAIGADRQWSGGSKIDCLIGREVLQRDRLSRMYPTPRDLLFQPTPCSNNNSLRCKNEREASSSGLENNNHPKPPPLRRGGSEGSEAATSDEESEPPMSPTKDDESEPAMSPTKCRSLDDSLNSARRRVENQQQQQEQQEQQQQQHPGGEPPVSPAPSSPAAAAETPRSAGSVVEAESALEALLAKTKAECARLPSVTLDPVSSPAISTPPPAPA